MRSGAIRPRATLATVLAALVLAACTTSSATPGPTGPPEPAPTATSGPSAMPTPTLTPTPAPTPAATPTATPDPTATPVPDIAGGLQIGSPFELVDNPADPTLQASFTIDIAGVHLEATMRGREVTRRGVVVGYAFVEVIDGLPWTKETFDIAAQGGARNVGGKLTFMKIAGKRVGLIKSSYGAYAMYRLGDSIVLVGAETVALAKTLVSSVIKAN